MNDGLGTFADSGEELGSSYSRGVALGDVDGDGDLDAFIANRLADTHEEESNANKVWLNDGLGTYTDSGQDLGSSDSYGVALGDVDGDGDLDAFTAEHGFYNPANNVWLYAGPYDR